MHLMKPGDACELVWVWGPGFWGPLERSPERFDGGAWRGAARLVAGPGYNKYFCGTTGVGLEPRRCGHAI